MGQPGIVDKKEKKSITLDPEILNAITAMAEEDERSFSQYVNGILRQWVNYWQKASGKAHLKSTEARESCWISHSEATFGAESLDEKGRS